MIGKEHLKGNTDACCFVLKNARVDYNANGSGPIAIPINMYAESDNY
jgi:hypothetical protein